jgi:tetratricopeptide (TPR) repeat protein
VAIEGPLRELGLHDVFQLLDLSRKTGVLRITSHLRNNEGTVYFEGGAIVYAEIRSNPHRIGERLLRAGKITEAELERARTTQEKEGGRRRLGQVLVGIGALSERELQKLVESHIAEVVLELLSWREGFFSFTEGPLVGVPGDAKVTIRTESLLMEGARRIDEWSRIEAHVPHLGVVPVLRPVEGDGGGAYLDLLPGEWEVLALVDGERDVRQIALDLGRSEFEVARTLVGLVTTGVLAVEDRGSHPRQRDSLGDEAGALLATAELRLEAGDAAAAKAAALAAAAVRPGEPRVHLVLARAYLREAQWAEAAEECRKAVRADPHLTEGYKWYGLALAATGKFREAREQWEKWDRLAASGAPHDPDLAAARSAAATLERVLGGVSG